MVRKNVEQNTTQAQPAPQNHAAAVVARNYDVCAGRLLAGGIDIHDIARRHGTPAYVYDAQTLDRKYELLRHALPAAWDIYYSVKANPQQAVLKRFLAKGCGLEIASGGELRQALAAGADGENILFAGPGKSERELKYALQQNIGAIHVESLLEAERLAAIARGMQRQANIALRINPACQVQGGAMRMGGKAAPFGVDEENLVDVVQQILELKELHLTGIHLFTGTQILDHAILLKQYRHAVDVALQTARLLGRPLETLDVGGGFGIPYFAHESELNLDELSIGLTALMDQVEREPLLKGTRFIVEPGRFLVGEAGIYVARINDIKESRGKKFLILDGGMHHHLAASGNLGQTIKRNYPVALLGKLDEAPREKVDIVGPLCTPLDTLARDVELPCAAVGDLVGVFQSGAYGRSSSPLGFLSHDAPPEIWVEAGRDACVRRRGGDDDYLADQLAPEVDDGRD